MKQDDIESLIQAANNGDVNALYQLGLFYSEQEDFEKAFSWFQKAANKGFATAYTQLGYFYLNGFGTEEDPDKCFECFSKASVMGDKDGIYSLAKSYYFGWCTPRDVDRCFDLMESLCQEKFIPAMEFQSDAFHERHNKDKSLEYLRKAVACGAGDRVKKKLAKLEAMGDFEAPPSFEDFDFNLSTLGNPNKQKAVYESPKPSPKAPLCFNWYKQKAESGDPLYLFYLGNCYEHGFGTAVSNEEALNCYRKAADKGIIDAQHALGVAVLYGRLGLKADKDEALKMLQEAADYGSTESALLVNAFTAKPADYEWRKRYKDFETIQKDGKFGWTNHKYEYQKPVYNKVIITGYAIAASDDSGTRVYANLKGLSDISFPFQDAETGKTGWKDVYGNLVIPAVYDHLERNDGEIIACINGSIKQLGGNHQHSSSQGTLEKSWHCSIQNGKFAAVDADGSLLTPYVYDEVCDWGTNSDVIYLRNDYDFCYINHNFEEILTDRPENVDDLCPYFIGERQNPGFVLVQQLVDDCTSESTCFCNGHNTDFTVLSFEGLREVFVSDYINDFNPDQALASFFDPFTYIYSGYLAIASDGDINWCFQQLAQMGCFRGSWEYIIQVSVAPNNKLPKEVLLGAWNMFDNFHTSQHIGICYDDSLEDNDIAFFVLKYYRERRRTDEENNFYGALESGSVEEIKQAEADLNKFLDHNNPDFYDFGDDEKRMDMIASIKEDIRLKSYLAPSFQSEKTWKQVQPSYEYLLQQGFKIKPTLWQMTDLLQDSLSSGFCGDIDLHYAKDKVAWLVANGTDINFDSHNHTSLDNLLEAMKYATGSPDTDSQEADAQTIIKRMRFRLENMNKEEALLPKKQLDILMDIYNFLKSKGAKHSSEFYNSACSWAPDNI